MAKLSVGRDPRAEASHEGLMTYGDQRRHVQSPPQATTTTSADPRFLFDGAPGTGETSALQILGELAALPDTGIAPDPVR